MRGVMKESGRTRLTRELPLDGKWLRLRMTSLPTHNHDGGQSRTRRDGAAATFVAPRRDQLDLSLASYPYDSSRMFHPFVLCFF